MKLIGRIILIALWVILIFDYHEGLNITTVEMLLYIVIVNLQLIEDR